MGSDMGPSDYQITDNSFKPPTEAVWVQLAMQVLGLQSVLPFG